MVSKAALARASAVVGLLVLMAPRPAAAQYDDPPRPPAYALEDVTVVQADGQRLEGVTLVVRGAIIESMGRGVTPPADATVLGGDSLVVYPGLVDADGAPAHEFPSPDIDVQSVELWNAPRAIQGFLPSRAVVDHLTASGEDLDSQRQAGIVASAVHPRGPLMPGRGALILNRVDADTPAELVLVPELGPKFELRGGPGVYPATLFGVMAFFRQAFEDARHRGLQLAAFAEDPAGLTAPVYDADYAVLRLVLDGLPVLFAADDAADILRVVRLADEYGFRPVLLGGAEAWKVADELAKRDIPVVVTGDFPEPRRWDPDSDEPLDAEALREKEEIEAEYANAGRLAEAGVTLVLASGGSGEILESARKAVEYGLAPTNALTAMTRTPAELFGVGYLARVEAGRPATFVVASGDLFQESTDVVYTFVEGWMEEGAESRPAGDPDEAVAFAGTWSMEIDAEGEMLTGTLVVIQDGATFSGTLTLQGDDLEVRDGAINGNDVQATALMSQGGQTLEIELTGTVEGDRASGEADAGPMGTARWTARRTGPGGAR